MSRGVPGDVPGSGVGEINPMLQHFPLTIGIGLLYNYSSTNSFPFNQAVSPIRHQVFTRSGYLFSSNEEPENENKNRNDRARSSLLPQVRGLVYAERCRSSSNHLSIVQKSALDVAAKVQQEKRSRVQGELIQFHLHFLVNQEDGIVGWIRLHRSMLDHDLWDEKPFSLGQAWIDLLFRATWQDEKICSKRSVCFTLKRGEFHCSYRELAKDWGWKRTNVERFIRQLIQRDMLVSVNSGTLTGTLTGTLNGTLNGTLKNKITSIFSIVNWDKYQDSGTLNGTLNGTLPGTLNGTLLYNNELRNKERKKGSLSEKSREPEAEPVPVRAKAKLVI